MEKRAEASKYWIRLTQGNRTGSGGGRGVGGRSVDVLDLQSDQSIAAQGKGMNHGGVGGVSVL